MKRLLLLPLLLSGAAAALADEAAGLAAVDQLGRANGQALACKQMNASARTRNALIAHAPKTRQSGEAFEAATNKAFLAPAACDRKQLDAAIDTAVAALRQAYPGAREAETPANAEIVTRYLLQDHNGRAVSDQDFRGRFQLLTFGYTSCPDVCPTTLAEMAAVLKVLGDDAKKLQPLFITVDPERDTTAVLKDYTGHFDTRILGLTGSPELIRRVADNYRVRFEKVGDTATPASYVVDHSAGMFLLGPDGRYLTRFAYAMPVDELARRIGEYLKSAR
jgi:protein SCO1